MSDCVIVDFFDHTMDIKGKKLTYEAIKACVLKAGKFSVFEATASQKRAKLFDRLCKDPEIEITRLGFPWTGVKLKTEVQP